jgi:uncharacterized membrane protein
MKTPAEGTLRIIATFVAAFGIGVAGYLTVVGAGGDAPVCLAGSKGCEIVTSSSHSELLGIDVALLGLIGYIVLLACALLRGDGARMAGFVVSLAGFGFSVYLTYLELFIIDAICQWCVASALLMTVLFALNAVRMVRYVGTPR